MFFCKTLCLRKNETEPPFLQLLVSRFSFSPQQKRGNNRYSELNSRCTLQGLYVKHLSAAEACRSFLFCPFSASPCLSFVSAFQLSPGGLALMKRPPPSSLSPATASFLVLSAARRGERQESWLRVYTHATLFYMNYHRRGGIGDSGGNSSHLAFFQLALPLYQTTMLDGRIYQDIPCTGFASCANSLVLPPEAAARLYLPEAVSKGALIVDDLDSVDDLRLSEREVYTAYFCNAASADVRETSKNKVSKKRRGPGAFNHSFLISSMHRHACTERYPQTTACGIMLVLAPETGVTDIPRLVIYIFAPY